MSIIFDKVRWVNFLSTGNAGNTISLNSNCTTLIAAQNASGKSSILDAIIFALFGKPHRDVLKNQLINSINGKNCIVEIWFNIDADAYMVRRGIKPNVFEIFKNGVLINQDAATRDYQKFLEQNILKTNARAFTQSVILGAASFTPFMKMRTQERREIIEDFLDIKIFGTMHQILKEEIYATKSDVARVDSKFAISKTQVHGQKTLIAKLTAINDQASDAIKQKIEVHVAQKDAHKRAITQNNLLMSILQNNLKCMDEVMNRINDLRAKISTNNHKLSTCANEIRFFKDTDECPSCRQEIEDRHRNPIVKQMSESCLMIQNESERLTREFNVANIEYDKLLKVSAELRTLQDTNRDLNKIIRSIDATISALDGELSTNVTGDLFNEKLKLKEMATLVISMIDEKTKLSELRCLQDQAYDILKDGGVKTTIIREYLPVINRMINHYLGVMEFYAEFTLDENFNELVKSRCRDEFSYESFSEGEKKRIDIAILFAWRQVARLKNSVNANILFLDEILDGSLDADGMDAVFKIIEVESKLSNIFVISHNDHFKDKFENIVTLKKVGDFSVINDSFKGENR